jgi:hypothetical protein
MGSLLGDKVFLKHSLLNMQSSMILPKPLP